MPSDINKVLSYKEWLSQNSSVSFEKRREKYERYLQLALIDEVIIEDVERANVNRSFFKSFVDRLAVIYKDDDEVVLLQNIDFNDPEQIVAAVPLVVAKIRDISTFYKSQRRKFKNLKTEYSTKGTEMGLERAIKDYFFSNYTTDNLTNPNTLNSELKAGVPTKEDIKNDFKVDVVELFNTHSQSLDN